MNARLCEQTFGLKNMHAERQTDRRTDGCTYVRTDELKYTPSRTCACKHTNACIDECMHVRSKIWTHEHARGQAHRQTNRRTYSHIRPHKCAHAHTRTLALINAPTKDSGSYAMTDIHMHTCSYGGKHKSTNMEVTISKSEVRN